MIPVGKDQSLALSKLPVFQDSLNDIKSRYNQLDEFMKLLEARYTSEQEISLHCVTLICVAKIACIDFALQSYYKLKMQVGAYSAQVRNQCLFSGAVGVLVGCCGCCFLFWFIIEF